MAAPPARVEPVEAAAVGGRRGGSVPGPRASWRAARPAGKRQERRCGRCRRRAWKPSSRAAPAVQAKRVSVPPEGRAAAARRAGEGDGLDRCGPRAAIGRRSRRSRRRRAARRSPAPRRRSRPGPGRQSVTGGRAGLGVERRRGARRRRWRRSRQRIAVRQVGRGWRRRRRARAGVSARRSPAGRPAAPAPRPTRSAAARSAARQAASGQASAQSRSASAMRAARSVAASKASSASTVCAHRRAVEAGAERGEAGGDRRVGVGLAPERAGEDRPPALVAGEADAALGGLGGRGRAGGVADHLAGTRSGRRRGRS